MGELQYAQLMQEMRGSILPDYDPNVVRVKRVLTRLVEGLEKLEGEGHVTQGGDDAAVSAGAGKALDGWDVHVIANDEANAFVLPG